MAKDWKSIVPVLLTFLSSSFILPTLSTISSSSLGNLERCSGRLERALDELQRDSPRRNRLEEEEAGIVYQEKLQSAPIEMIVSKIAVKLPRNCRNRGGLWARVERCSYEPSNNALQTRVTFNDLSVSGLISILPKDYRASVPAESCRMSLRLRRAGIEFYTSPIARGRGQMRIRTESSFLEPRFASIYAFGCRPVRVDKQIKRYDKWPQSQQMEYQHTTSSSIAPIEETYEAPEPREIAGSTKEEDVTIVNGSAKAVDDFDANLGVWRKNVWVTKIPRKVERKRSIDGDKERSNSTNSLNFQTSSTINPTNFVLDLVKRATDKFTKDSGKSAKNIVELTHNETLKNTNESGVKISSKRETTISQLLYHPVVDRREREFHENNFDEAPSDGDSADTNDYWQSREAVSNEMEDVFLRGASQALTRYIERELHPAIKETLMLSMGYTVSYG